MKYSKQEVMQFVQEEDVKFLRLAFCDVTGKPKNVSIMPTELERAFEHGIAVKTRLLITVMITELPTLFFAVCPSFLPRLILTKAQQPSPIITAIARATTVSGNTTVFAALP